MKKLKKKPAIILTCAVVALAIGGGTTAVASYNRTNNLKKEAYQKAERALKVSLKDNAGTIEYAVNGSVNPLDLIKAQDENGSSSSKGSDTLKVSCNPKTIDPGRIGTYKVVFTASSKDHYNQKVEKKFTENFTVEDKQAPVVNLTGDSVTLENGKDFDPASVIAAVNDPVDGDLEKVDAEPEKVKKSEKDTGPVYEKGWYTVSSNVDNSREGDYTVSVHACDRNGNVSDQSVPVHVNAAMAAPAPVSQTPAAAPVANAGTSNASPGDTGNATLNSLCDNVLGSITNNSMDDYSRCYAIYQWTENNIRYTGGSSHADWVSGAITALSTRRGDCYAFYSAGRALLTRAGFSCQQANIGDAHYWVKVLYNGQWLNWDATTGWGAERFLYTDDQLRAYRYYNAHYGGTLTYAGY